MNLQRAFDTQVKRLADERQNRQLDDLRSAPSSLRHWIARIRGAESQAEVFAVLDEFRALNWTDQERAEMSKCYMRRLEVLVNPGDPQSS